MAGLFSAGKMLEFVGLLSPDGFCWPFFFFGPGRWTFYSELFISQAILLNAIGVVTEVTGWSPVCHAVLLPPPFHHFSLPVPLSFP